MGYIECSSGGLTEIDFLNPLLVRTAGQSGETSDGGSCNAIKNGKILVIFSSSSKSQSFSVKKNDVAQSETYNITSRSTNTTMRIYYFDVIQGDTIDCTMYTTNNFNSTLSVFQ